VALEAAEPAEPVAAQTMVLPAAEPAEARAAQPVAPENSGSGPAVAVEHMQVEQVQVEHSEAAPRRLTDAPGADE